MADTASVIKVVGAGPAKFDVLLGPGGYELCQKVAQVVWSMSNDWNWPVERVEIRYGEDLMSAKLDYVYVAPVLRESVADLEAKHQKLLKAMVAWRKAKLTEEELEKYRGHIFIAVSTTGPVSWL